MQTFVEILYYQYSLTSWRRMLALSLAALLASMSTFGFTELALAQTPDAGETEFRAAPEETSEFPYKTKFVISAYYSPLPDQEYYLTGNYTAEIRLNGSGVNSADGTAVYPGMIAAPKKYPFGTKMSIVGLGNVAVHDRGGAIVPAGERGYAHDRLDVWMGHGEVGLRRALAWGKRTVEATVYGIDPSIQEAVNLDGLPQAKYIIAKRATPSLFRSSLTLNDHGEQVVKLQKFLAHLDYFNGEITGYYGDTTRDAVARFQLDQDLIKNLDDFAAGSFGVGTRLRLEAIIGREKDKYKEELPVRGLGKGDKGPEVDKLQQLLMEMGYLDRMTGMYDDVTLDAVLRFQIDQNVIQNETDRGAGYFGPQTEATLRQKFLAKKGAEIEDTEAPIDLPDVAYFDRSLSLGDNGADVTRLQENLKILNYLRLEPTGSYGDVTRHAVFKFQQRMGILADKNSQGAGVFGPQTRVKMNDLLISKGRTQKLVAVKTLEYNSQKLVADAKAAPVLEPVEQEVEVAFVEDLGYGSRGKMVRELQLALRDLGFFDGRLTSEYFGRVTKEAVAAFQVAHNLVDSLEALDAGELNTKTRELLNRVLQG